MPEQIKWNPKLKISKLVAVIQVFGLEKVDVAIDAIRWVFLLGRIAWSRSDERSDSELQRPLHSSHTNGPHEPPEHTDDLDRVDFLNFDPAMAYKAVSDSDRVDSEHALWECKLSAAHPLKLIG